MRSRTVSSLNDLQGIWLHNFLWAQLNPGGLIESYWYTNQHIYSSNFDHRDEFGAFYRFVSTLPLNNGNYRDAQATVSNPNLRVWGQKDLVNQQAHLWIANANHTWQNVVIGSANTPITGTVILNGFQPNSNFIVEWWNTYQGQVGSSSTITSDASGNIVLMIDGLSDDLAVRVHS